MYEVGGKRVAAFLSTSSSARTGVSMLIEPICFWQQGLPLPTRETLYSRVCVCVCVWSVSLLRALASSRTRDNTARGIGEWGRDKFRAILISGTKHQLSKMEKARRSTCSGRAQQTRKAHQYTKVITRLSHIFHPLPSQLCFTQVAVFLGGSEV